jgi:4-amino-4-deoxy-L-arabinose transferase-like glycosyltransferase
MTRPAFFYALFAVVATFLGCYLCVIDDRANQMSLAALTPLMKELTRLGNPFVSSAWEFYPKALPYMCLTILVLGLRRRCFDGNLIFLALALGLGSEYFLLLAGLPGIGIVGYVIALVFVYFAIHKDNPLDPILNDSQKELRFTGRDAALLGVVTLIALIYRTYAINYNLNYFEGELSTYSAAATSIPGMFMANRGHGAWAPLGLLYYIPIWVTTELFNTTLVALRLSSAIVGVFTIPFIYFFARRLAGKEAALLSALLVALNTQHVGWGRTDIHPHGVTTWPAVLVCIAFLRACEKKRVFDWFLLVLAMGLTWHQYPSGQSAVAIPVFAAGIYFILNGFRLPFRWYNTIWIALGVILWFIGLPLSYWWPIGEFRMGNPFNLTGPRALWGGLEQHTGTFDRALLIAQSAIVHLGDVIEAIFYRARYIFHQDFLADVHMMAPRTYPWILTPFMVVALVMLVRTAYRLEVAVLLAWIVAAVAPGIFSEQAYPKRLSTLFPALDIVGAIGIIVALSYIRRGDRFRRFLAGGVLSGCLFCYAAFEANVWFSNTRYRMGEPPEVQAMKTLATHITPGSLVIAELSSGYYAGKVTYLLLDHLTAPENRPNVWYIPFRPAVRDFIQDPLKALNFRESWAYQCTKLREQADETAAVPQWKQVVFILQEKPNNEDDDAATDIEIAKQRCEAPQITTIPGQGSFWVPLVVITCNISDLRP